MPLSLTRRKKDAMPENSGTLILSNNYLTNILTFDSFDESPSIQIRLSIFPSVACFIKSRLFY